MHADRDPHEFRLTMAYAALLGALAVACRLVPAYLLEPGQGFLWNLMPVGAAALFAGSRLPRRVAWLFPLGVMLASDLLLAPALSARGMSAFSWTRTPVVYAGFAGYALLGMAVPRGSGSPLAVGAAALAGSIQFFLVTNLGAWAFGLDVHGRPYDATFAGLLGCFEAALPFHRGTVLGDLLFSAVFFAGHALLIHAWRTPAVRAREAV